MSNPISTEQFLQNRTVTKVTEAILEKTRSNKKNSRNHSIKLSGITKMMKYLSKTLSPSFPNISFCAHS